jgi:16S rRNA G966 N2-methylase RsmD/uncharacterized protein YlaI
MTKNAEEHTLQLDRLLGLYARPLPSTRSGALFNAFSYPTKISPESIALYIATHTQPGAVVMDTFAGSGTTGLAAKLCDQPTATMIRSAKELELTPVWGPRHAILYELGVIGSCAAEVMCTPPDPDLFDREASALVKDAYTALGPLLDVSDDEGRSGTLRHAIWSEVLACQYCGHEHSFWDTAVEQSPLHLRPIHESYQCPNCRKSLTLGTVNRATETVFDELLGRNIERRKRIIVQIYGKTGKRKWQRASNATDQIALALCDEYALPASIPVAELKLGDLYRSGYHFGLSHLHHLYTRRNLICVAKLLELVELRDASIRPALRLLVLSYNQSHATLMARVVVKNGLSDFVLTGAQSGVLYVSSLPVEKNVIEGIARKVKPLRESFALVRNSRSTVVVHNQSSTLLAEETESVDYLFTDPPFADFIPYAEINQINELWLGKRTDDTNEVVISRSQSKSLDDYGRLMSEVFAEAARVLKPQGVATVVFHAAKANVWSTLQKAYHNAGFNVAATSVLDKLQASFKQVVSTVSVKGDPLLLLTKSVQASVGENLSCEGLIEKLINQAKNSMDPAECEPTRLYSRYVNHCLEMRENVLFNADQFYAKVSEITAQ